MTNDASLHPRPFLRHRPYPAARQMPVEKDVQVCEAHADLATTPHASSFCSWLLAITILLAGIGFLPVQVNPSIVGTLSSPQSETIACPDDMTRVRLQVVEGDRVAAGEVVAVTHEEHLSRRVAILRAMLARVKVHHGNAGDNAATRVLESDLESRLKALLQRQLEGKLLASVAGVVTHTKKPDANKRHDRGEPLVTIRPDDSDVICIATDDRAIKEFEPDRMMSVRVTSGELAGQEIKACLISIRTGDRGSVLVAKVTPKHPLLPRSALVELTPVAPTASAHLVCVGSIAIETLCRWCRQS
ncbi:MAG: hypothetical protein AAGD07_02495 [Planctomycetota bacterium]